MISFTQLNINHLKITCNRLHQQSAVSDFTDLQNSSLRINVLSHQTNEHSCLVDGRDQTRIVCGER